MYISCIMYAIGLEVAIFLFKEGYMAMEIHIPEDNVDHFLISTHKDQLLFLWIEPEGGKNPPDEN